LTQTLFSRGQLYHLSPNIDHDGLGKVGNYEEGNLDENVSNVMCRFNPTTLVAGLGSMLGTNTGARSGHDRKSTRDEAGCLHRCFGDWKTLWPLLSIPMPFAIQ
jgi:hypothetical protein